MFATNEVVAITQVTTRQLQWWHETRVIAPTFRDRHTLSWDEGDLFKALLLARMRSKAISLQRIRTMLKSLPLEKLKKQEDAVLLIRQRGMRICGEEVAMKAMDLEDGPVWIICISPLLEILAREVRKRAVS